MCRVRAWALCHAASLPPGVTSDKARYVTHDAVAGAPDGHCAHLPPDAAPRVRCTVFVRGRVGARDLYAYLALRGSLPSVCDQGRA